MTPHRAPGTSSAADRGSSASPCPGSPAALGDGKPLLPGAGGWRRRAEVGERRRKRSGWGAPSPPRTAQTRCGRPRKRRGTRSRPQPQPVPAAQCEDERRGWRRAGGRHQQRAARHPLQQAAGPALPQPRSLRHGVRRPPRRLEGPGGPQVPAGAAARQVAERARGVRGSWDRRVFRWGDSGGAGECRAALLFPPYGL